jgi:Tetratricopeptide repeat
LRGWPDEGAALNNLSNFYADVGRVDEAIGLLERAVAKPDGAAVYIWNLMRRRLQAGDVEGSAADLGTYVELYPGHIYVPWARLLIPYVQNDRAALHEAAVSVVDAIAGPFLLSRIRPRTLAHVDVLAGRLDEARSHFNESRSDAASLGRPDIAAQVFVEEARFLAELNLSRQAVIAALDGAYAHEGLRSMQAGGRLLMEAIAAAARSGDAGGARARLDGWRREDPDETATAVVIEKRAQAEYHVMEAEGDFDGALEGLDALERRLGCAFCSRLVQDRARILAKDGQTMAAIQIWESERDRPINQIDLGPVRPLFAAINLAPLYEAAGDTANAIASHQAVVDAWAAGDAGLQPAVRNARERITALGAN